MAGFTLITGNRLERLARELALRMRDRPMDPFTPETVIIQSRGMERWLALEIARRNGIAANLEFPFPDVFLRKIIAAILTVSAEETYFRRDVMAFRIFNLLPGMVAADPGFDVIGIYLQGDSTSVKRWQLAEQIAFLFDQYLVFRPDLILAWDDGRVDKDNPHARWQAQIWRALTEGVQETHRARLGQMLLDALNQASAWDHALPTRVSIFGISYLPPIYLDSLFALSRFISVDFYHLNPCQEYWADLVSHREGRRLQRAMLSSEDGIKTEDLHLEVGNHLLASMGTQGRTFQKMIDQFDIATEDLFQEGRDDTLLAAIQNDILCLRTHGGAATHTETSLAGDRSIQIHACHSPMREIEVLYDQVLELLNTNADMEPRDILVLMPDIETYAPYIQAVFGSPENEALRIPYSIADRGPIHHPPLVDAFFFLLALEQSRFQASEIHRLIELPAVRSRFGLHEEDLGLIERWIAATRIRWGLDAASKSMAGLPATEDNTWQTGLDRLLLGYALAAEDKPLFQGSMPSEGAEGSAAEVLGHLAHLLDCLKGWQDRLRQRQTPSVWASELVALLDDFFRHAPADEHDLHFIRRTAQEMGQCGALAGMNEPVGCEVVTAYLKRRIEEQKTGAGFMSGGVTFGALLPMRSIPAKALCLLGMNQDAFPRQDQPLGFDLMAAKPRIGDRSRRNDDKYLFLEALVSARRYFYVSYIGQDIQDNTPIPPSVLVSELMDYVAAGYRRTEDEMITYHRLQAFSPAYFDPHRQRLFSYSEPAREAALSLVKAGSQTTDDSLLIDNPLPEWDLSFLTVDVGQLSRAIDHPCRFLLEQRLQIQLREYPMDLDDRESFALAPLDRQALGQRMLVEALQTPGLEKAPFRAMASGRLPHGEPGRQAFEEICEDVAELRAVIKSVQGDARPKAAAVRVEIGSYTLTGTLDPIYPSGQLWYRYGRARGVDLIEGWLRHLLWCHVSEPSYPRTTTLINRDGIRRFHAVANPDEHLRRLLEIYHQAGHAPLPFFPRSSWEYAQLRFEKGYPAQRALERVRSLWQQSFKRNPEADDPYIQYCFNQAEPLDHRFVELTEAIFRPILQAAERVD